MSQPRQSLRELISWVLQKTWGLNSDIRVAPPNVHVRSRSIVRMLTLLCRNRIDEAITIYGGWCPQMFLAFGSVQGRDSFLFSPCAGYAVSCSSMFLNSTRFDKTDACQHHVHSAYNPEYQTGVNILTKSNKHVHFHQ